VLNIVSICCDCPPNIVAFPGVPLQFVH